MDVGAPNLLDEHIRSDMSDDEEITPFFLTHIDQSTQIEHPLLRSCSMGQ